MALLALKDGKALPLAVYRDGVSSKPHRWRKNTCTHMPHLLLPGLGLKTASDILRFSNAACCSGPVTCSNKGRLSPVGKNRCFSPELTVLSPHPQEDNCWLRGLLLLHPVSADF